METIATKTQFNTFFLNEPLIVNDNQLDTINEFKSIIGTNIFIGIGLVTDTHISEGLPFDILGMLLIAEKIRIKLKMNRVIVQIALDHAISNGHFEIKLLQQKALTLKKRLIQIVDRLGLNSFDIKISNEFDKSQILNELRLIKHFDNEYLFLELVDIEFFRRNLNVSTKLSWIITGTESNGHDERFFDDQFEQTWNNKLNFIHIQPGFTFEKSNRRVSPYIHKINQNRILIQKDENVSEKILIAQNEWNDKAIGGAIKHLKDIVRVFESLFGHLGNITIQEKIKLIINKIA